MPTRVGFHNPKVSSASLLNFKLRCFFSQMKTLSRNIRLGIAVLLSGSLVVGDEIEFGLTVGPDDDHSYVEAAFDTQAGVMFAIEESPDLTNWTSLQGGSYYGLGNRVYHPLVEYPDNEGGTSEGGGESPEPTTQISLTAQRIKDGGIDVGINVRWNSLDDGSTKTFNVYGQSLHNPFPMPYAQRFDDYYLFVLVVGSVIDTLAPYPDVLGPEDSAMMSKLVASIPAMNFDAENIALYHLNNPPPPPSSSNQNHIRVTATYVDSDGDNIQDHTELGSGTNPFSSDTDGDGLKDDEDEFPFINNAHTDPDGAGLPEGLENGLVGRWDFESATVGGFPSTPPTTGGCSPQPGSGWLPYSGLVRHCALLEDIGSGYLEFPTNPVEDEQKLSLSFWIRMEPGALGSITDRMDIFGIGSNKSSFVSVPVLAGYFTSTGKLRLVSHWINDSGPPINAPVETQLAEWDTPSSVDDGDWHHVAIVKDQTDYQIFVDAQSIGPEVTSNNVFVNSASLGIYFYFGRMDSKSTSLTKGFKGRIDRMRVYNRKLVEDETNGPTEITSLYQQDADWDGLYDYTEGPSLIWRDKNGNGIPEYTSFTTGNTGTLIASDEETLYLMNPFLWDPAHADHDGDELTSIQEQNVILTSPANPDTDGDLMPDGWEHFNGLNPLVTTGANGANGDMDQDGVSNIDEFAFVSDPNSFDPNNDSDGDGVSDLEEMQQGSHPGDPTDEGQPIPTEERYSLHLGVGDESMSHSEDYVLNVYKIDLDTGIEVRYFTHRSGGHGAFFENTYHFFRRSDTYSFQIDWQSSSQGTSANGSEGPDFDYTFKVEPPDIEQLVKVDSYDPKTKHANRQQEILGEKLQNVETFLTTIENRRVIIRPSELTWHAFFPGDQLEDNKSSVPFVWDKQADPGAVEEWMPGKGKRIFPGKSSPASESKQQVKLKVVGKSNTQSGKFYLRILDVDDPTPHSFDSNQIIDTVNGGADNLGQYVTILEAENPMISNITFSQTGGAIDSVSCEVDLDDMGEAELVLRVNFQPGDNTRVCGSSVESDVSSLQVGAPMSTGYVTPDSEEISGFSGIASEMLTVWRKLFIEVESMSLPAGHFSPDLSAETSTNWSPAAWLNFSSGISGPDKFYENGFATNSGSSFQIKGNSGNAIEFLSPLTAAERTSLENQTMSISDDDSFGLPASLVPLLPNYDMITDDIVAAYAPAYIQIENANNYGWNTNSSIPFESNVTTTAFWAIDDNRDLEDAQRFWVYLLGVCYQGSPSTDGDPVTDTNQNGWTKGVTVRIPDLLGGEQVSGAIYLETTRDVQDSLLRGSPTLQALAIEEYQGTLDATVAHEIGHGPDFSSSHHDELGIMTEGSPDSIAVASFTPLTIRRFRKTIRWAIKLSQ